MRRVFVDTVFWVATASQRDTWREPALKARRELKAVSLVTTDEVLTEFMNAMSGSGPTIRQHTAALVRRLLSGSEVSAMACSRDTFLAGLTLYEARADKGYSLTDCISMATMRAEGITEVLTNDHHFEQEGFSVLIRR